MATYLVTGHAGFIGSTLSRNLIELNHRVIGIDSITNYYSETSKRKNLQMLESLNGDYKNFELDINKIDSLERTFKDFDLSGIFHLAGQPGVRNSWSDEFAVYSINNIVATQRIFDFAKNTIPLVCLSSL